MPCSLEHAASIETNGVGSTAPFLTITMSSQRSMMKTRPLPSFGARMAIGCANVVLSSGKRTRLRSAGVIANAGHADEPR